jgi:hypothetical protein
MEPLVYEPDEVIKCDDPEAWFDSYVPVIPSKYIINKVRPGFGATYSEIKANRHSIVVLANVATILSKHERHGLSDNTFAVYEDVTTADIVKYLTNSKGNHKLLTTPEALTKVLRAFKKCKINGYKDYFILLDECQKYIQDIDYRPRITIAFDDFFRFDNNAMVSSTPIKPSDPRFKSFKCLKLQPNFKYSKPIKLLFHNDILQALKDSFDLCPEVNHCVFFNTINGIIDLIKKLKLFESTSIFCSKESNDYVRNELAEFGDGIDAYYKFEPNSVKKYNFFTSSFFTGLDIVLEAAPQVIMISLPTDRKTYLDPYTDVAQILGRFRKHLRSGNGNYIEPILGEAIHLLPNYVSNVYKSESEVKEWITANRNIYNTLLTLMRSNINQLEKEIYKEALERLPFHRLLADKRHLQKGNLSKSNFSEEEGFDLYNINYFMYDNLFTDERVNSYYALTGGIREAYETVGRPGEQSYEISTETLDFNLEGQPKLNLRGGKRYSKETIKKLVYSLTDLDWFSGDYELYDMATYSITENHPLVRHGFDKLGRYKMRELEYNITKIKQAIIDYDVKGGKNSHPVIDSIYNKFYTGVKIPLKHIKKELQLIYDHYKIPTTAKASDILQWFEAKKCTITTFKNVKKTDLTPAHKERFDERGYILRSRKFNQHSTFNRN